MHLSLVIPCYNEAENVSAMHDAVESAFANCGFEYEMVFVDDGSRDGTYANLRALHERSRQNIRLVRFSRNFGKESALFAGLGHAAGEYVTLIDADLQQRPEVALEMVRFLDAHNEFDCVTAFQAQRREGKLIAFLKRSFYRLMNRVTEIEFVQGASDFRTMRRCMVDAVLSLAEHNRFSKGIFSWVGFQTHYIPYTAEERNAGTSKWGTWKLFKYALDGIISFTTMPLRLTAVLGGGIALLSLVYMMVVIIQKLFFEKPPAGYATQVALILLLGGIQLLCMGILGEYLAKTYVESKRRPIYIAREVIAPKQRKTKEEGEA
ncbi:MAG: glycosyltransferase family 2 protein [Oscillospiraceae bacterium]|jgi:glycosyltransferase involved in cell wall biosynthesis|nr:glycosyltransferase family 2 protein [Oscillospiraceae bacterium]